MDSINRVIESQKEYPMQLLWSHTAVISTYLSLHLEEGLHSGCVIPKNSSVTYLVPYAMAESFCPSLGTLNRHDLGCRRNSLTALGWATCCCARNCPDILYTPSKTPLHQTLPVKTSQRISLSKKCEVVCPVALSRDDSAIFSSTEWISCFLLEIWLRVQYNGKSEDRENA